MSEWQPIATAPMNGEIVLITDGLKVYAGCFTPDGAYGWHFFDTPFYRVEDDNEFVGKMITEANAWLFSSGPTHWMPLPLPPEATA